MNYQIELVARAFFDAEYDDAHGSSRRNSSSRSTANTRSNAIDLLHEDIGVLLVALEGAAAEEHTRPIQSCRLSQIAASLKA